VRRVIVLALVAAALVAVSPAGTADRLIAIAPTGFVPRNVTVNVGETVTWSNTDTRAHQVVVAKTTCNFTIQPASTGSCTFRTAGKFNYQDPNQRGSAWRGTVTVQAGPLAVTIVAKPAIVTYRTATTLSGSVSNGQANERVTVQGQLCGSTSFATVATVSTTTSGVWTLAVQTLKTAVYQARWRSAAATTTVKVRPRVTLRKLTASRFAVRVLAAQSFSGKVVVFQRYNATRRTWVRVRFVVLRSMGGTAPTFVSGVNFRSKVRVGTRIRAVIGSAQVAPCYLAGTSNVVRR
jgi:plastocyanin